MVKGAILAVLFLAACSGGEEASEVADSASLDAQIDLREEDGSPDFTAEATGFAGEASELVGVWASLQVASTVADVPLLGEMPTLSKALLKLTVVEEGDGLMVAHKTCALTLESDTDVVATVVPDSFVAALTVEHKPSFVSLDGAQPAFVQPKYVELHGLTLDDPVNDAMPGDPEDPRILDLDNDGNPGLTIFITGLIDGALYVVQRARSTLDGTILSAHRIEGQMLWEQEQVVLGSDNPILAENHPETWVDPVKENSYFIMIRVDDDWGCEQILSASADLFDN